MALKLRNVLLILGLLLWFIGLILFIVGKPSNYKAASYLSGVGFILIGLSYFVN